MNDVATWGFLSLTALMMGVSWRAITHSMKAELIGLGSAINGLSSKIEGLEVRIEVFGTEMDTKLDRVENVLGARIDAFSQSTDHRFDAMTAGIRSVEKNLETKLDRVENVLGTRIDANGHRIGALESDMSLVKAHIIHAQTG